MFRFLQFLAESFAQNKMHRNPSIEAIKNLAKNNEYHSLRYVANKDGSVVVGDTSRFLHIHLSPERKDWHSHGTIVHLPANRDNPEKFKYSAYQFHKVANSPFGEGMETKQTEELHPFHVRLEKHGFERTG